MIDNLSKISTRHFLTTLGKVGRNVRWPRFRRNDSSLGSPKGGGGSVGRRAAWTSYGLFCTSERRHPLGGTVDSDSSEDFLQTRNFGRILLVPRGLINSTT